MLPSSPPPPPGRLPGSERTPFIGRERERSILVDEIQAGARLLTITGPSGMGKTRLARQVMGEVAPGFAPAASWFVSLAGCRTATDIESSVARVLGLPQEHGPQLAEAIGSGRPMLLVLDNVDSLAPDITPLIETLLDHCEGLQLLVTSLVPLGMGDEIRFELGELEADDAIELYLDRMHRAWAERRSPPEERPVIEELVRRLDRIPLAIELAAARSRILPPQALLSRISDRFELLQSSKPGRHGSLYRALALTWELLSPAEQEALTKVSVFLGGFSLEAAEAILGDAKDPLGLLDELRSKALLQLEEAEPPRFAPYESVREFALLQLDEERKEEIIRLHVAFFREEGERHAARIDGPGAPDAIRWLALERENLLAAHRRSLRSDPRSSARVGLALSAVVALQGPPASELELLDSVVEAARASGDPEVLCDALYRRGGARTRHGLLGDAEEDLGEVVALSRSHGDRIREGFALAEWSLIHVRTGAFERAFEDIEIPLEIARAEEHRPLEGFSTLMRGVILDSLSHHDEARECLTEALTLFRRLGNHELEGRSLFNLAVVASSQGRFRDARRHLEEARTIFRDLGHQAAESYALINLASVEATAGELDRAEAHIAEALRLGGAQANRRFGGLTLGILGMVSLEREEFVLAEQRLFEAFLSFEEGGDHANRALFQAFLSVAEAWLGRFGDARRSLEEARSFFLEADAKGHIAVATIVDGIIRAAEARSLLQEGKQEEADELLALARRSLPTAQRAVRGTVDVTYVFRRLLEKALGGQLDTPASSAPDALLVAVDGGWFERRGGNRVDLRRRQAVRRLFSLLVKQRLESPGVSLGSEELFERAWGGEKVVHPEAARARLYTSIWTLRALGLSKLLLRTGDGYMLDPEVPVALSPSRAL